MKVVDYFCNRHFKNHWKLIKILHEKDNNYKQKYNI